MNIKSFFCQLFSLIFFQPFKDALEFFRDKVRLLIFSDLSGGGTFAWIWRLYKYLYVSVRIYSITWLTPIISWSSIGGTHGLFSNFNILLELKKSNWPNCGGKTVNRFPWRWSSLKLVKAAISSGTSIISLSRIARILKLTRFLIFGDKYSKSLSLENKSKNKLSKMKYVHDWALYMLPLTMSGHTFILIVTIYILYVLPSILWIIKNCV